MDHHSSNMAATSKHLNQETTAAGTVLENDRRFQRDGGDDSPKILPDNNNDNDDQSHHMAVAVFQQQQQQQQDDVLSASIHAPPLVWKTWNVRDYGAVGNGVTDDTAAFQAALQEVAKYGGGTLEAPGVPTNTTAYLIRPLDLSHQRHLYLHLGHDVTLLGHARHDAWPLIPALPSYGPGRGLWRHQSLIFGAHAYNVTIQGSSDRSSILDGQGYHWWPAVRNNTLRYGPGHVIEFMYSSHVRIYDLQQHNSPTWNTHFYDCDHVHVRGVHIWAPESSPFTDGWDPDSTRHVLIEDSSYAAGDDCVAIKSGWDCFGIDYGKPSINITIRNITCHGFSAGIALGSEMSGGIENVTVEEVRFTKSNKPANIKVGETRGGYVRNVVFRDIIVDGPIQRAIHVDTFYNYSPNPACPKGWKPPTTTKVSNISFVRINGKKATYYDYKHRPNETFHFVSNPKVPIQNVYMQDVYFPLHGLPWNCSAVQGIIQGHSVEPWPPCDAFVVQKCIHAREWFITALIWLTIVATLACVGGRLRTYL